MRRNDRLTRSSTWLTCATEDYEVACALVRRCEVTSILGPQAPESLPLLGVVLGDWLADKAPYARDHTIRRLEIHARRWETEWDGKHLGGVSPLMIQRYIDRRRAFVSDRTANLDLRELRAFFRWAGRRYALPGGNPCELVRYYPCEPREPRALTDEERVRLLEIAQPELQDVLYFLLETGLRVGACFAIQGQHLDLEGGWLHLPGTLMKGRRRFSVPLSPRALDIARRRAPGAEDLLFPEGETWVRVRFEKLRVDAKLAGLRLHDLRATCATNHRRRGLPIEVVQALLGHEDPRTLLRHYAAVEKQRLLEAVGRGKEAAELPLDTVE